jgi:hypothetical protein
MLTIGLLIAAGVAVMFALYGNRLSNLAAFSWIALP